jgi:hypothetical protein
MAPLQHDHQAFLDADEVPTRIICRLCGKDRTGPPVYCCPERRALVERVETPQPIRLHGECGGQGCDGCKGLGIAP